jgi:hypothetical protein
VCIQNTEKEEEEEGGGGGGGEEEKKARGTAHKMALAHLL